MLSKDHDYIEHIIPDNVALKPNMLKALEEMKKKDEVMTILEKVVFHQFRTECRLRPILLVSVLMSAAASLSGAEFKIMMDHSEEILKGFSMNEKGIFNEPFYIILKDLWHDSTGY